MSTRDFLDEAFARFTDDRDEAALLASIEQHGGEAPPKELDTPIAHRICDVCLGGVGYRVVRVYDRGDDSTKLFIYPTKVPSYDRPGIPFERRGAALREWVEEELARQASENDDDD